MMNGARRLPTEHKRWCGCEREVCGTRRALDCAMRTRNECEAVRCVWCCAVPASERVKP